MSASFDALRRANPRANPKFAQTVDAAANAVRARLEEVPPTREVHARRRRVGFSAAGLSLAAAAAVAAVLTVGSPGGENATAAVERAATVTAASAERSGIAVVRITHDGRPWAGKTVRWNGADLAIADDAHPSRPIAGELRLVDGTLYGVDETRAGWVVLGSPDSIDPGSGTTPAEHLAAVREDVGGATLRRISEGMTGLTTRRRDGSTVYSGTVAAGLIARESGFKEGRAIRVFPFGYVAHDEAADPSALLDATVTVGADSVIRNITLMWGTRASAWSYTVTYRSLGATPAPVAPANARPLRDRSP